MEKRRDNDEICVWQKKWLAAGIAALLISGAGAVSDVLAAPVYTSGITTKAKKIRQLSEVPIKWKTVLISITWKTDQNQYPRHLSR